MQIPEWRGHDIYICMVIFRKSTAHAKSRLMLVKSAILAAEEENYSNLNTDSRTYSQTDTLRVRRSVRQTTSQTDRQTGQTDRQLQIHKTHSNLSLIHI